jgi:hypothetical protein
MTAEKIEGYNQLIQTTTADFEDRLERIDERLDKLLSQRVAGSGPASEETEEIKQIREERLSTETCIQICARLSEHLNQIRLVARRVTGSGAAKEVNGAADENTNPWLDECEENLSRVAMSLASYEKELFNRLAGKMRGLGSSTGEAMEIARLRDEWESTHRSMEIVSKAGKKLEETVSVIENRAKGDNAIQLMVSADGQAIHGINQGEGEWARQVGGRMSNETVQEIMRSLVSITVATSGKGTGGGEGKAEQQEGAEKQEKADTGIEDSKFDDLYGKGQSLERESPTSTASIGKVRR